MIPAMDINTQYRWFYVYPGLRRSIPIALRELFFLDLLFFISLYTERSLNVSQRVRQ